MIYKTIYNEINTILSTVKAVKEIYKYPTSTFTKYPAVVFFPSGVSNVFSTTTENFREYKFKLFVVVGIDQTTMSNVFENVMSNTCDEILEAFDTNWSLSNIDGKRTWVKIDSGNWSIEKIDKGLISTAEFEITVKLSAEI